MDLDLVTGKIVDAAYRVHTTIGPGLLESVYLTVMERELRRRGLAVERQKGIDFVYDGISSRTHIAWISSSSVSSSSN